jgi:hypothetical protein
MYLKLVELGIVAIILLDAGGVMASADVDFINNDNHH